MVLFILFFILYAVLEGYEHGRYPYVFHYRAALRRIASGVVVGYALCGLSAPVMMYIVTGVMLASLFWLAFDISYNLAKGEAVFYIGNTSSLDKRLNDIPLTAWLFKFGLVALSIIVYAYAYTPHIVKHGGLIIELLHN